jgi:hypothetical protein
VTAPGTAKTANAEFAVATGEASAGSQGSPKAASAGGGVGKAGRNDFDLPVPFIR